MSKNKISKTGTGLHFKNLDTELFLRGLISVLCDNLDGWDGGREAQEGGNICMHIADSLHCTAETNPTL